MSQATALDAAALTGPPTLLERLKMFRDLLPLREFPAPTYVLCVKGRLC